MSLHKFVVKGNTTQTTVEAAVEELEDLATELVSSAEDLRDAFAQRFESDDREERAEGKERIEQIQIDLVDLLERAGAAVGMTPFTVEDAEAAL